jgi:structure-specific recognition protein 1
MRGSLSNLIAKTFKVIAREKVFIPGKFANSNQQACLNCSVRVNEGLLYALRKQFVFIHKPPILVRFNEVDSVEFQRYAGGQGSTRNFDLCVNLKQSVVGKSVKDYTLSGIDRADYAGLCSFLSGKKIPIKNLQGAGFMEDAGPKAPVYNEEEIFGAGIPADKDEDGSDDEEYYEKAAEKDAEPSSGSDSDEDAIDNDEMGSEVDEELDSDLEEHRSSGDKKEKSSAKRKKTEGDAPAKKPKKAKKSKITDDDDNDNDDDKGDSPKKKNTEKGQECTQTCHVH